MDIVRVKVIYGDNYILTSIQSISLRSEQCRILVFMPSLLKRQIFLEADKSGPSGVMVSTFDIGRSDLT
jgi:hypothetical protein